MNPMQNVEASPVASASLAPRDTPWVRARSKPVDRGRSALGWFSVGLGLAQLVAPRKVARWIGVDDDADQTRWALRAVGARELTCGLGLLSQSRAAGWAWLRVAGDVMDLALLGSTLRSTDTERTLGAMASVVGVGLLDAKMAVALGRARDVATQGIAVSQSITINRTPEDVYSFFRDLENLPRFMSHLVFVRVSNGRSHWRARGPLGAPIEWDAEIVEDRPAELIEWRSVAGADVPNQGRVQFCRAPGARGTELVVDLRYDPPAGAIGVALAELFQVEPAQEIASDLRRLKQVLETGEVVHSDASIHWTLHSARPPGQLEQPE